MDGASHTRTALSVWQSNSNSAIPIVGYSTTGAWEISALLYLREMTRPAVSAAKTDGGRRTSARVDEECDELTLIFFARHRAQASWERRSRRGSPPPLLAFPVPPSPDAPAASSVFLRFLLGAGAAGGGGKARAGDRSWSSSPLESIFIAGPGITLLPLGPSRLRLAWLLGGKTSPMATRSRSRTRSSLSF